MKSIRWHVRLAAAAAALAVGGAACLAALPGAECLLTTVPVAVAVAGAWGLSRFYLRRLQAERRQNRDLANLHLSTVQALAGAIDAKDQASHQHIHRVERYAAELGRALGLTDAEIAGVRTAALLHDVGQLAVPDHILSKPGPLTHEEFEKVRTHPEIGARIIAQVPFPYPVAPLVLSHHERWDGDGYPAGLKGEAIPLGARILRVVDYYDALTSDRPYHRAMGREAAVRLLQEEAGRALDPKAVAAFVALLPRMLGEDEAAANAAREGSSPTDPGVSVFDDIALAHKELYTLYEIAHAMGTSLSLPETLQLIASKLTRLVPFASCALFVVEDEGSVLRCRCALGPESEGLQWVEVPLGADGARVAGFGTPLVDGEPWGAVEADALGPVPVSFRSSLVCPLVRHDRLIGAIGLYHTSPGCYTEDHGRLLLRVADQAAGVVHNSLVFEQTRADSLTDPLTGLPNMRFLFLNATRELARAARLEKEVSLLVLDLDHFKEVNDRYGHRAGDQALREVASVLRGTIRPYDVCARYAGDEFVVVLPGCGEQEAEVKRQELQAAVSAHLLWGPHGEPIRLSVSVGLAVFPGDGESYEELLARADNRMYRDKGARRGRRAPAGVILPFAHVVGASEPDEAGWPVTVGG